MAGKLAGAGGAAKKGQLTPTSEPNVIPFIDIMLVLLIIFMVTAPIPTVDIRVDLPPPNPIVKEPEEGKNPTLVVVSEDAAGTVQILVDDAPATMATLGEVVLRKAIDNNWAIPVERIFADARIFVRADQATRYGNVIRVMSQLQEDGFVQVGILAEAAQEG